MFKFLTIHKIYNLYSVPKKSGILHIYTLIFVSGIKSR